MYTMYDETRNTNTVTPTQLVLLLLTTQHISDPPFKACQTHLRNYTQENLLTVWFTQSLSPSLSPTPLTSSLTNFPPLLFLKTHGTHRTHKTVSAIRHGCLLSSLCPVTRDVLQPTTTTSGLCKEKNSILYIHTVTTILTKKPMPRRATHITT